MKIKRKTKRFVALAALITAIVTLFSACAGNNVDSTSSSSNTPGEDGLTSIVLFKKPSKTKYYVGEIFDPSGMVLKANYEDGKTKNLLYEDCEYNEEPLKEEDKEVEISFGSQSVSVAINVSPVPEINEDDTPELKRITLVRAPSKTKYLVGETFDPMGILVKAVFSDGSEVQLPVSDLTYPTSPLTESDTVVKIEYKGFTVNVDVTVEKYAVKIITADEATYRLEAESTDLTNYELMGWAAGKAKVESNAMASNSKCLSNLSAASGYVEYVVYSEIEEKVNVYLCGALGTASTVNVKDCFNMSWNDSAFTATGAIEMKGWSEWQRVRIGQLTLKKGENKLRITFPRKTSPNLDYIEFEVGSPAQNCDVEIKSGETQWKAEAENCKVTGTPADKKTAFTEGAGNYLCRLGVIGNKVTVTIFSDEDRTVSVGMKAGHNYSDSYATLEYSNTFSATLNGEEITLNGQFTNSGWTTFAEVNLGNVALKKGVNTLVFTVKNLRVPNIDSFIFKAV